MSFDYKKEFKAFYQPPREPGIIDIPSMNFIAIRGQGDPNEEGGSYQEAVEMLYALAYTLKMSHKSAHKIEGFFEYTVPPLEGLWVQTGKDEFDPSRKDLLQWTAMIRLPDFVSEDDCRWAREEAKKKKKKDFSTIEFFIYDEGLCVQSMHIGSYDEEKTTLEAMIAYAQHLGFEPDLSEKRLHHEIYLSDPRKTDVSKLKTVIRLPIRKK